MRGAACECGEGQVEEVEVFEDEEHAEVRRQAGGKQELAAGWAAGCAHRTGGGVVDEGGGDDEQDAMPLP